MNDEIKKEVQEINSNLDIIRTRIGGGWSSFWRGILGGLGYVLGAFIAVLIIGWVLNILGIIPAFQKNAELWRNALLQSRGQQVQQNTK